MKRFSLIATIAVLVGGLIFAGFPAATQAQVIKLVYTDHNLGTSFGADNAINPYLDSLEKAAMGGIKIERYYGQTLAKGTDAWNAAKTGLADMAWCAMGYWSGQAPLSEIMSLPFVPFKSSEQASGIFRKLYNKFPEMQKEYDDVHVLIHKTAGLYRLFTVKKQVKTLEDLKGLKIRALGGPQTDAMRALGAVPTMVPFSDIYIALQKGVVDGVLAPIGVCEIFNIHEPTNYMMDIIVACAPLTIIMNKNKWNSLSPAIQKGLTEVSGYDACRWLGKNYSDALDFAGRREMAEYEAKTGHKVIEYTPPPEEKARWQKIGGKPVWDTWVARVNKKGLPGQEVLDELFKLVETEP